MMKTIKKTDRILVTGGTGLIGRNLVSHLRAEGYDAIPIGSEYDLRDADRARMAFKTFKPEVLFHLAAKVGGIYANSNYKASFYSDNVLINTNVVNCAVECGLGYVFAMGTGCAYPKRLEDSILFEEDFLDGVPEVTNDAYAYAKRGLLVHLQSLAEAGVLNYTFCLPANIYGPHDNFHPMNSHVVPALIRRFYEYTQDEKAGIPVWGDGTAARDFLYIDDCLEAMILLAQTQFSGTVNVGTGKLETIRSLSEVIAEATGYQSDVVWDTSYPSGQMQRIMSVEKIRGLGWEPKVSLRAGIKKTVEWFDANKDGLSER